MSATIDEFELPPRLHNLLKQWCESSPFCSFVLANRLKIRKKFRNAYGKNERDGRSFHMDGVSKKQYGFLLDVFAELKFAYLISPHAERIHYEPPSLGKAPDFSVEMSGQAFSVEIKRLANRERYLEFCENQRRVQDEKAGGKALGYMYRFADGPIPEAFEQDTYQTCDEYRKWVDAILSKCKQLLPGCPGLLWFQSDSDIDDPSDMEKALYFIHHRYKNKDPKILKGGKFRDFESMRQAYLKLSAVGLDGEGQPKLSGSDWNNIVYEIEGATFGLNKENLHILRSMHTPRFV